MHVTSNMMNPYIVFYINNEAKLLNMCKQYIYISFTSNNAKNLELNIYYLQTNKQHQEEILNTSVEPHN